jgi:hypothetical protein
VLPLPQRKYRLNRRGKEMTKKQIVMAKKRKISTTDDSEPPKKSVNLIYTFSEVMEAHNCNIVPPILP